MPFNPSNPRPDIPLRFAKNGCLSCLLEWEDNPGGRAVFKDCPRCGHIYWIWLNYQDFKEN